MNEGSGADHQNDEAGDCDSDDNGRDDGCERSDHRNEDDGNGNMITKWC